MADAPAGGLSLLEDRYARLNAIPWWDQARLRAARVLVVGAGALGNEVIKNLALLGIGHLAIADMDTIELSNLTRSALFRARDAGEAKATVAARAARDLCADVDAFALEGNVLASLGLGWFRWADVVVGALDNREARVFVNQACARVGRPWIDGGIEVLNGIVRGFHPPLTACYECTMSATDWRIIDQRRSCSMLARRALAARGVPTTPTSASVIGGIQAQEVVKVLHGMDALLGAGFFYEGATHRSYRVEHPVSPECPWHEAAPEIEALPWCGAATPFGRVAEHARARLGGLDAIDSARELVEALECAACGQRTPCRRPLEALDAAAVACPGCGGERIIHPRHSFAPDTDPAATLGGLGIPAFDILFARHGERVLGLELTADAPPAPGTDHAAR